MSIPAPATRETVQSSRHSDGVRPFRWPALDGLRAVAIGIVFVGHVFAIGGSDQGGTWATLGVELFFVISGFLITWLLLSEYGRVGDIGLRRFYQRRALRILPAYYVYLGFVASFYALLGHKLRPAHWWAALTYTVNFDKAISVYGLDSLDHLWSLAVEEQFYLLWPAVLLVALRGGRRRATMMLLGSWGAISALRYYQLHTGVSPDFVHFAFQTRCDSLIVGCVLAVGWNSEWLKSIAAALTSRRLYPVATGILLALVTATGGAAQQYAWADPVTAVLCGALVIQLLHLSSDPVWRWLDHPLTRGLGVLSYSIYLYHGWGIVVAQRTSVGSGVGALTQAIVGLSVTLGLALGSYLLVERPLLRWRDSVIVANQDRRPATAISST